MEDGKSKTIEITFGDNCVESDFKMADKILNSFKWHWKVPTNEVQVKVEAGWITLEGKLQWQYQKEAAKRLVCNFAGVKGITNNIIIKSDVDPILAQVFDHEVRLKGTADLSRLNDKVEIRSQNTHGFWIVDNELVIEYND